MSNFYNYLTGVFLGGVVSLSLQSLYIHLGGEQYKNRIPRDIQIQEGFVKPSKLEVKLKDLDGKDGNEVIFSYDKKDYLLKLNEKGEPKIVPYEVKPAQVIELEKKE